jgi:hypothetical protein
MDWTTIRVHNLVWLVWLVWFVWLVRVRNITKAEWRVACISYNLDRKFSIVIEMLNIRQIISIETARGNHRKHKGDKQTLLHSSKKLVV